MTREITRNSPFLIVSSPRTHSHTTCILLRLRVLTCFSLLCRCTRCTSGGKFHGASGLTTTTTVNSSTSLSDYNDNNYYDVDAASYTDVDEDGQFTVTNEYYVSFGVGCVLIFIVLVLNFFGTLVSLFVFCKHMQ